MVMLTLFALVIGFFDGGYSAAGPVSWASSSRRSPAQR